MPSNAEAASLLASLFSHSHLAINVPECSTSQPSPVASSSRGSSRSIAFYDEILTLTLHLELPPTAALPPPGKGWASYPLPVQIDELETDDWEERTEQARATRLALLVLLNNLHIDLRGAYATPRSALPPGSSPIPPTSAATSSHSSAIPANQRPTPSTERRDAAYSEPSLPGDEVPFYNVAWLGNKAPPEPVNKERTAVDRVAERRKRERKQQVTAGQSSREQDEEDPVATSFASWDQREERWRIEWSVKVPVVYARHRHPHPALVLTSSVSLRLSPSSSYLTALSSSLSGISSYLRPAEDSSWADHDLLTTLSSGPVYPDESPSQRAARAASALAKLPLSRLPSKVLGTRLVTPERSARDVGLKLTSAHPLPSMTDEDEDEGEGDVTDGSSSSSSRSSSAASWASSGNSKGSSTTHASSIARSRDLSEEGLMYNTLPRIRTGQGSASDAKEGDTIKTLTRSVRCALDVRSAVGVRMRTTIVPSLDTRAFLRGAHDLNREGADDEEATEEDVSSSVGRALVLCVEIDNTSDSGLLFHVDSCDLDITVPGIGNSGSLTRLEKNRYHASATLLSGADRKGFGTAAGQGPFQLAQGEQRNLLYVVQFSLTAEGRETAEPLSGRTDAAASVASPWPWSASKPPATLEEPSRNVAIVLHGRPLLLDGHGKEPLSVTPDFSSTWNCTLDMASLQEDLRRRMAAEMPSEEVLTSAAVAPASGSGASGVTATAIGGSARHSASALASALRQDDANARANAAHAAQARPGAERSASSRFLPTPTSAAFGRLSPIGLGTPKSSPQPSLISLPPYGNSGQDQAVTSLASPASSSSSRVRPSGTGLLAQARMRAATLRIDEQPIASPIASSAFRTSSGDFAVSRDVARRTDHAGSDMGAIKASTDVGSGVADWVTLRRLVTPDGPRARVRSAAFATPTNAAHRAASRGVNNHGQAGVQGGSFIVPFRLDRDLSWQKRDGLLLNTRIRPAFEDPREGNGHMHEIEDDEGEGSGPAKTGKLPFSISHMGSFHVEVLLTNRTDVMKTYILHWAESPTLASEEVVKDKLMDAETARRRYDAFLARVKSSAVVPLENYVSVGPILPGASELALLPMMALMRGRHSIGDLLISDQVSGEERVLRGAATVVIE
ncbi:hypothetical protein BCV69DRAFT_299335 [Microstroma glucosiphilum]|uniref:Uncharacterized protein n=1 Tax=Pseudomicrostroma glucosiphilum TaxID=1684307 RepID=A0A316U4K1_9BASI|nr:hypothetical protein BCV69DRAFT_299335 [Pseudomicrostroma glucosiphilum]PWN20189.1 hypothetical protein BCV69DRAFT_299335 [Pseudomicrostroma glucosiphilum]